MPFYIVGTAGHIDHGKTELAKALTGIQTDRLKEEQERGMSIKLGFAPLSLGQDLQLGLVAIPKSSDPQRIAQNLAIGDFTLDEADMQAIAALDRGARQGGDPVVYEEF